MKDQPRFEQFCDELMKRISSEVDAQADAEHDELSMSMSVALTVAARIAEKSGGCYSRAAEHVRAAIEPCLNEDPSRVMKDELEYMQHCRGMVLREWARLTTHIDNLFLEDERKSGALLGVICNFAAMYATEKCDATDPNYKRVSYAVRKIISPEAKAVSIAYRGGMN